MTALIKCSSDNGGYRKAAKLERKRYLQCREELGDEIYPYLELIKEHILIEVCLEPNTAFSNSCKTYGINHRTLGDTHSFVGYMLFPEVLTKFLMENRNQNYKNASHIMYGERLPTEHHGGLLLQVC